MDWRYYLQLQKKLDGHAYSNELVVEAFHKVNRGLESDGIFHLDKGNQYTSNDYESLLKTLKRRHSYSNKGYPYDNATIKSFNVY